MVGKSIGINFEKCVGKNLRLLLLISQYLYQKV